MAASNDALQDAHWKSLFLVSKFYPNSNGITSSSCSRALGFENKIDYARMSFNDC